MSSVVVKSVNEAAVRRAMDEYAARLFQSHPEVEEVVVFGSMAKGNYAPGSDIDVFILLSHSDESVRDRVPEFLPGSFPVPVDVFPYTRDEAARLASSPIIRAVEESRWRYSRPRT